jgi:glycosyltransferase involved in cell wall biosynthesis
VSAAVLSARSGAERASSSSSVDPGALRVLMVSPQYRPILGGYERAAERLAGALAARGHRVEVVTERRSREWPAREAVDGVQLRRIPCVHRRGLHQPTALASLAVYLAGNARRFDVVHAHQYGPWAAMALAAARLAGARTVLKLTSTAGQGIASTVGATGISAALHLGVDACVTPSLAARDEAVAFGIPAGRVHVVPNGIDVGAFSPAPPAERARLRSRLGLGAGPVALYLGRLSEEKAPLLLLEAWSRVAHLHPGAELAVVGGGPQADAVRRAAAGLPRVRVAGETDDPAEWYRAADLFVVSSLNEGLSNALLEAAAVGLPVVSTRVSGSTDLFARADLGALVPVGDAAALGAAVSALLADPDRRARCGAAARGLAVRAYGVDRVAEMMERVYRGAAPIDAGNAWPASASPPAESEG